MAQPRRSRWECRVAESMSGRAAGCLKVLAIGKRCAILIEWPRCLTSVGRSSGCAGGGAGRWPPQRAGGRVNAVVNERLALWCDSKVKGYGCHFGPPLVLRKYKKQLFSANNPKSTLQPNPRTTLPRETTLPRPSRDLPANPRTTLPGLTRLLLFFLVMPCTCC